MLDSMLFYKIGLIIILLLACIQTGSIYPALPEYWRLKYMSFLIILCA